MFSIKQEQTAWSSRMMTAGRAVGCWEGRVHGDHRPGKSSSHNRSPIHECRLIYWEVPLEPADRRLIIQTWLTSWSEQMMKRQKSKTWTCRRAPCTRVQTCVRFVESQCCVGDVIKYVWHNFPHIELLEVFKESINWKWSNWKRDKSISMQSVLLVRVIAIFRLKCIPAAHHSVFNQVEQTTCNKEFWVIFVLFRCTSAK